MEWSPDPLRLPIKKYIKRFESNSIISVISWEGSETLSAAAALELLTLGWWWPGVSCGANCCNNPSCPGQSVVSGEERLLGHSGPGIDISLTLRLTSILISFYCVSAKLCKLSDWPEIMYWCPVNIKMSGDLCCLQTLLISFHQTRWNEVRLTFQLSHYGKWDEILSRPEAWGPALGNRSCSQVKIVPTLQRQPGEKSEPGQHLPHQEK